MNQLYLIGNITADPELKTTNTGKKVANFTVAVNEKLKGEEKANYFDCQAWERLAEIIESYTSKGAKVAVIARGSQQRWEKDGQKHSKFVWTVQQLELLTPKQQNNLAQHPDLPNITEEEINNIQVPS